MHLQKIVNTESPDSFTYKSAQTIFRQICVQERRKRMLEEESVQAEYMTPLPRFEAKKIKWGEVVKRAFINEIKYFTI